MDKLGRHNSITFRMLRPPLANDIQILSRLTVIRILTEGHIKMPIHFPHSRACFKTVKTPYEGIFFRRSIVDSP